MLRARLKPVKEALERIDRPYPTGCEENAKQNLDRPFVRRLEIPKAKRSAEQSELCQERLSANQALWMRSVDALTDDLARRKSFARTAAIEAAKPAPRPAAYAVANRERTPPGHVHPQ